MPLLCLLKRLILILSKKLSNRLNESSSSHQALYHATNPRPSLSHCRIQCTLNCGSTEVHSTDVDVLSTSIIHDREESKLQELGRNIISTLTQQGHADVHVESPVQVVAIDCSNSRTRWNMLSGFMMLAVQCCLTWRTWFNIVLSQVALPDRVRSCRLYHVQTSQACICPRISERG
jgi:hypothetical protein